MKTNGKKLSPTGIGLPGDLKLYLTEQAKAQDRSLSREIVRRLTETRRMDEQRLDRLPEAPQGSRKDEAPTLGPVEASVQSPATR